MQRVLSCRYDVVYDKFPGGGSDGGGLSSYNSH